MSDLCERTIAILDDDPFALESLAAVLDGMEGFHVAWTSRLAKETVERCLAPDARPDVLLLDMSLGTGSSGAAVCRRIRSATASVPILAMTSFALSYYRKDAAISGAQGVISKTDREGMTHALRTVAAGGTWGEMFDTSPIAHIRMRERQPKQPLSEREIDIMNLLAAGRSINDIAIRLDVSASTVKTLTSRAKRKLGAVSLREAVAIWMGEADA